jgi:hypothetical protein
LIPLWLLPLGLAQDVVHEEALAAGSPADAAAVRHHVAQARQFVKNHWYADAALEIQAALELPDGRASFDVAWLGAQIYYELVDIDHAQPLATRAAELADTDPARDQATAFATFLHDTFGFVEVRGPYPGLVSRLQIECTSLVFDADLKRLINKVSLAARDRTDLPARLALPAGDYLVNGVAVTVPAGTTTPVLLDLPHLGDRGLAALQVTRLEVSAGTSVLFGDRVDNLRPGGAFELALTQPLGPVLLGVVGTYDLRTYGAGGSRNDLDPHSFGGGLRVGREIVVGGPLGVRPSVGVRYGLVPGIGLGCNADGDTFTCAPLGDTPTEVEIYAVGRAVIPYAELSVEYREAGRTTALGAGVKAAVEQYVGTVASPGDAVLFDASTDADLLPYRATPATWSATGIRLSATLSFAF